jgi:hypothetical protein
MQTRIGATSFFQPPFSSEVHWGQRIAFIGIEEKQYMHSLVVGTGGGVSS